MHNIGIAKRAGSAAAIILSLVALVQPTIEASSGTRPVCREIDLDQRPVRLELSPGRASDGAANAARGDGRTHGNTPVGV
jgi:hypothetical protein